MSKFVLKNVRAAFLKVWTPEPFPGSPDKTEYFSGSFIIKPTDPQKAALEAEIDRVGTAKWGAKWPAVKAAATAQAKICLRDGATKPDTEGYEGNWFVSARSKVKPKIYGLAGKSGGEITQASGKPYSGCYVNVVLSLFAYQNVSKGVASELGDMQFAGDGDAFAGGGGARASDDDFGNLDATGDNDPLAA